MKIVLKSTSDLIPYAKNAKVHNATQIANVANSIKRFGWQQPIVIDDHDVVVICHCRLLAAKKLGLPEVPVTIASGLTEDEIRELRIADNKTNESAWDWATLAEDIDSLDFSGFEGFEDILDLVNGIEVAEEIESVAKAPSKENPRGIRRGDLFKLGEHRLLCGSSTDQDEVKTLMDGQSARLLFTSPPYSDLREYNGQKDMSVDHMAQFIPCYAPFAKIQAVNLGMVFRESEVVPYWNDYIDAAHAAGLKLLAWNVWDKLTCGNIGQQKMMVPLRHEFIFVFGRERVELRFTMPKKEENIFGNERRKKVTKRNPDGSTEIHSRGNTAKAFKKMESVLKIPAPTHLTSVTAQQSENGAIRQKHPATFPVLLPSEYIVAFTEPGDSVIEPFCGSGTTLIACENLGRACFGMELDPVYCNVILDRWEEQTGGKAVKLNG